MSAVDPNVPANEHGILRLFTVDADTARPLKDTLDNGGSTADLAAAEALGVDVAEAEWVDLLNLRDIEAIGIDGYLLQGYDVPEDQLASVRGRLESANGYLLAVPSRTFGETEQQISPIPGIRPLAQFQISRPPDTAQSMTPADTEPFHVAPAPEPPQSGRPQFLSSPLVLLILLIAAALLAFAALI